MPFDQDELQRALYERLTAALPGIEVYDYPPQQPNFPFVRIDGISATDAGTKDVDFIEATFSISAYYRDVSDSQSISSTLKAISTALHNQEAAPVMVGQKAITLRFVSQLSLQRGDDGDQYLFGMQRFRTLIQEL